MILRVLLVSWQGVRSRLGRSLLTALSLFVGVLAVVIIQAGAGAARDAIVADAILTGGRALTVGMNTGDGRQSFVLADRLRTILDRELATVNGTAVLAVNLESVKIGAGSAEMTLLRGDLRAIRPFPIKSGRWIGARAGTTLPIAINDVASSSLGLSVDSTAAIRLNQVDEKATVLVTGVVKDGSKEPSAYAPLDLTLPWVKQLSYRTPAQLMVRTESGIEVSELTSLLRNEYARVFDTGATLEVNRVDRADEFGNELAAIALIFSIVAGLSLIVGALGILNIGLATLRERSDELSLRRSFGATKLQVISIIVLEGQIVALIAAGLALGVGIAAFPFVASLMSSGVDISQQSFPVAAVAMGIAASCAAALAGSMAPALRAARVPIASIMRV